MSIPIPAVDNILKEVRAQVIDTSTNFINTMHTEDETTHKGFSKNSLLRFFLTGL